MCFEWYTCNGAFLPVYILLALTQVDLIRRNILQVETPSYNTTDTCDVAPMLHPKHRGTCVTRA